MKRLIPLLASAFLLWPAVGNAASRITTKDGAVYVGNISLKNGVYTIVTPSATISVPVDAVVQFDPVAEPAQPLQGGTQPATTTNASGPLRLAGSNTIGEDLMPALLEAFAATKGSKEPEWATEEADELALTTKGDKGAGFAAHLSRKGSTTAFEQLLSGKADIGMASRQVKKEEVEKLAAMGFGDAFAPGQENVLSLDGLIVVVNKDNPVSTLSLSQIADLFSGKITDWSAVGGKSGPVHIYARDAKSGTFDTFKSLVLAPGKLKLVDGAQRFESSTELSDKVANDAGGIGFAGFAYLRSAKALNIATDCGLVFPADKFFVRTEEYPLARRLFLYTPKTPTNAVSNEFIEYALGEHGQEQADKKGFINLSPDTAPADYGMRRVAFTAALFPQNPGELSVLAKLALGGSRLSVTFRFRTGSFELDSRAVRDVDRVAAYMKSLPQGSGRKLVVLGFSDSRGAPFANKRLSDQRALQISTRLHEKGVDANVVLGLGQAAPVACNSSDAGLEKNRRVEIWTY